MNSYFSLSQPVTSQDFSHALAEIRQKISSFSIPQLQFGALRINSDLTTLRLENEEHVFPTDDLMAFLTNYTADRSRKVVALALSGDGELQKIGSELWLKHDIVPFINAFDDLPLADQAAQLSAQFDKDGIADLDIDQLNEVHPSFLISSESYRQHVEPHRWDQLTDLVHQLGDKRVLFISATPRGGGVALMRHALIRLYRLLGVDAHWHILTENSAVFQITKTKFHNILQAVSDPKSELTEDEKHLFLQWSAENAQLLAPAIKQADVIVIEDPQPSGLIPHIKQMNPQARLLYRSHIQIVSDLVAHEGSPQYKTWQFLWQFIQEAEVFIAHPIKAFVPKNVPQEQVVYMPPTTDPLDGLNKPLSEEAMSYYMKQFNTILLQHNQEPLDLDRPYIVQVARFDPSKGIPEVIESYRQLREKMARENVSEKDIPQLVIVGHGSIDDPDGQPIYHLTRHMLHLPIYREIAHDIKTARLPHVDQLLNTLLRQSKVVVQLSQKEGFEIKVSEALMVGKPVVSFNSGGIPLQIHDQENGFVVNAFGNCQQVAEHLYQLCTDEQLYEKMSKAAEEKAYKDVLTVPNATRWLQLAMAQEIKTDIPIK